MVSDISFDIAGILGPGLMILSSSEYLNFKIWKQVEATTVYLNGLVLLIGGLVIIKYHNLWQLNWALIITILGWLITLLGAYRMYFPKAQQAQKNRISDLFLLLLFLMGCFLTYQSYFNYH